MEGFEDDFPGIKVRKRERSKRLMSLQSWVEGLEVPQSLHSRARDPTADSNAGPVWGSCFLRVGAQNGGRSRMEPLVGPSLQISLQKTLLRERLQDLQQSSQDPCLLLGAEPCS